MQITDTAPPPDTPLPLQQTPAYAAAMGRAHLWQTATKDGTPVAHMLCLRGPMGSTTTLRGPIWQGTPDQDLRRQTLRTLKPRLIEAEAPDPALRSAGYRQLITPTHIAEWDLTPDPDSLRKNLHGKWRNALRQAEAAPLKLRHSAFLGPEDHPIFAHQTALTRTHRFRTLPPRATCALTAALPQGARLWEARLKRQVVAMMLFLRHGPVVTYHIGWSGPEGRRTNAHNRLLMEAALWYRDQGVTRLDLGTVDTEAAPGLARFKIGTGALVRPLGGSHIRLF